jgi:hypothetical protein
MNPARRRFVEKIEPIEGGESTFENDERWGEIVDNMGYNAHMQEINKIVNVCGTVLVRPVPDVSKRSGFRLDIVTPDQFIPIMDPRRPGELIGVSYVIDATDSQSGFNDTRHEIVIYMGTEKDEPFFAERTNSQTRAEIVKQPYPWIYNGKKYLPFVVFRARLPISGEFVNRTHGRDLYIGTLEYANLLSMWERGYKTGTYKQLAITGPGNLDTREIIADTMAVLKFPAPADQAEIKQLDHTVDVQGQLEAIFKFAGVVLQNYGISVDDFKAVSQSGISIKLQNQMLIDLITSQRELFRMSERELAEVVRMENNRVLPSRDFGPISDTADFEINFGNLPFEESIEETYDKQAAMILDNIKSKAEVLLEIDPDLGTIENAQAQIIRNAQLNREATRGQATPTPIDLSPAPPDETIPEPVTQTSEAVPLLDILEETVGG